MDSKDQLASEQLILLSSDDENDGDVVIDYLSSSNPPLVTGGGGGLLKCNENPAVTPKDLLLHQLQSAPTPNNNNVHNYSSSIVEKCNNKSKLSDIVIDTGLSGGVGNSGTSVAINNSNNSHGQHGHPHANMVPIISVTPHSPGAKYNFLEDTLNHLQCIRESVVQMKNSTIQNTNFGGAGLIGASTLSSNKLFSSCPSLPDLTISNPGGIWPHQQTMYGLNTDRRKSWTAIEDLTECAKSSHKSVSLSSLDSEEQESLRAAERLHNRTSRNSTGGISTHSLNEAELARDFEKIVAKRNLAPTVCRIPLQKSISTPSIAPVRNQGAKEDNATPSRHLSDSEDETHDDRSLLCVRDKNSEGYTDHPEKRRKRGSLFFRKKKDKNKTKGQNSTCDACGAVINLATYKEHAVECKAKIAKKYFQVQPKSSSSKKNSTNSHSSSHHDDQARDYYDGNMQNDNSNYSDDTPLIRDEFLHEAPIGPHDLGAEPILGVAIDEHDSWSPSVPKEIVKSLKDKQVKRQEHIYEFIMTEKHHCQTLLVMQKVFVESLQKHFSHLNLERMFPRLLDLTELHTSFLKKLRQKQREAAVVDSIADILLDFFSAMSAQKLKSAYGEFCSNHRSALSTFKCYMTGDNTFAEWYKHCQQNPLLKKKGIPECILFVTQRLTKYPLLIDPLLKSSREDKIEQEKLQKAMQLVKEILVDVDARVADKEKEDRQLEIFKRIDAKSYAIFKKDKFKKSDIISSNRKLKFEGVATLMQGRSKMQTVLVVVLSDCLFFLLENSHKYSFFTPENKAGVVSLQKLLIREKAGTESRGIYIISSNPAYPEMFELKVQNPKDKNVWIQSIRAAVLDCPSDESEVEDYMTAEQRQKLIDAKQANIREIICKMRQKDFEQAILLEEKIALQLSLLLDNEHHNSDQLGPTVEAFISQYGSYRDLVSDDCDTIEIWKRVLNTIQEISTLAASLYTAATGLPLSRSCSSVGERQSEVYISPTLPKRAETFGGFDERRSKQQQCITNSSRDAVLSTLSAGYFTNRESYEKRESNASEMEGGPPFSPGPLSHAPMKLMTPDILTTEQAKDNSFAALHVSHHLHTLLCIISQQMTTIQSLQHQLNSFRENPKNMYRHNDQLEELRNLQDKLQEEKTAWQKQKETEERELDEQRLSQKTLQEQIRAEQEDIKQQREQLYRKMEILSSQGLLLSPSVALPVPTGAMTSQHDDLSSNSEEYHVDSGLGGTPITTIDRRKDKWRTASITSKTPPVNLVSATNAPKMNASTIKQQLPLKLSSLSSSSKSNNNSVTSPGGGSSPSLMAGSGTSGAGNAGGAGVMQMFPLKLADKKINASLPNHSRTGSSPAVIQQQVQVQTGNPATRTNTYPKIPERYRLRSSDQYQSPQHYASSGNPAASQSHPHSPSSPSPSHSHRSASLHEQHQHQLHLQQQYQHHQQQQFHPQHHSIHTTPLSSRHSSLQSPPPQHPGAGGPGMSADNNNGGSPGGGGQQNNKKDSAKSNKEEEVIYF